MGLLTILKKVKQKEKEVRECLTGRRRLSTLIRESLWWIRCGY